MDLLLTELRAAAEPTRLRLLALCAHAELTVTELTQILGQSQPRVSRHLKLLCEAGLLDRSRHGLGIDLSHEMLAVARANLARAGGGRHLQVRHGDMYNLPLPAAAFDLVTIHQVLHFADDPAAAIGEAARVLKPGGKLIVV